MTTLQQNYLSTIFYCRLIVSALHRRIVYNKINNILLQNRLNFLPTSVILNISLISHRQTVGVIFVDFSNWDGPDQHTSVYKPQPSAVKRYLFLRCLVFCYTFQLLTFSLILVHTHAAPEGHCYKCNVYSAQWPCRNNTHSPPPHFWYLQPPL